MDDIDVPGVPNCIVHRDRDSVGVCALCENHFCSDCLVIFEGADFCRQCLGARAQTLETSLAATERKLEERRVELERAEGPMSTLGRESIAGVRADVKADEHKIATIRKMIEEARKLLA